MMGIGCNVTPDTRRNIAFRRAVYQSSAANFNATGQLATDGIFTAYKEIRHTYSSKSQDSPQGEEPGFAFDGSGKTKWLTFNNNTWLQIHFNESKSFNVNGYLIRTGNDSPERDPKTWTVEGSNDGIDFVVLDKRDEEFFSKRNEAKSYQISTPGKYSYYRLNISANRGDYRTQLSEWDLFDKEGKTVIERPLEELFDSRWISASNQNEWIYVDLGTISLIDEIKLHWAAEDWASAYEIQLSDNTITWKTAHSQDNGKGEIELCPIDNEKARYVRLLCKKGTGTRFSLVEMEVYGSNNLDYKLEPMPAPLADGTQYLQGGNWRLQRASEVNTQDGIALSMHGFDDSAWLPAKVPGTILTSFLLAGAIPDPNYGDQQVLISDSYFTSNFWYRNLFTIPADKKGETIWLNFDAINWKADVYFNGNLLGNIEGAFTRKQFNITELANYGNDNFLAVLIHKNENPGPVTIQTAESPGKNGGILGADNPTIHASVGWDWVPTIRGRNLGIYNDVFISYAQDVQLRDPWIITDLDIEKDFSKAELTVKTILQNACDMPRNIVVKGTIQPGNINFESTPISLQGNENREVTVANLTIENPTLWWPNTYGEQFLYTATLTAYIDNKKSDQKSFDFGVREFTYKTDHPLTIYCNGTRIVCTGGNWGMDDSNLAATEEDYDIKVRLHAEANLTMIRNWVGMTGNEAFYRSCDKYGILIWDDFWLANPGDGPNPNDEVMFMQNAEDKVKRNRHHASLALYCGRNEGNPPKTLDNALLECTKALDGTRFYLSHSASGIVSGWGPYSVQDSEWYFRGTGETLHSERGMPNIPSLESMQRMLPEEHQWPIDEVWGIHDFTMGGAQGGKSFIDKMQRYGSFNDLPSFVRTAQLVNYESHKSLFEAVFTNRANGMLMWMSQSAWPSMVWQTYDYYYDTNAGYFGLKKANQPVNVIYNQATSEFVLTNTTPEDKKDLDITLNIFNLDGKLIKTETLSESISTDSRRIISTLDKEGLSGILFIKTHVKNKEGEELAENFTWINAADKYNYTALSCLAETNIASSYKSLGKEKNSKQIYCLTIQNTGSTPAFMIRVKTVNDKTKELILPVYYEDNYFSLMPQESKNITIELDEKHLNKSTFSFYIEGWNIHSQKVKK